MKLTLSWLKDHLRILFALVAGAFVLAAPIEYWSPGILAIVLVQMLWGLWSGLVAFVRTCRLVYRLVLPRQRADP
jgi:hypothetical protein